MCRVSLSNAAIMLKKCLRTILVRVQDCKLNVAMKNSLFYLPSFPHFTIVIMSSSILALRLSKQGSLIPTGIVCFCQLLKKWFMKFWFHYTVAYTKDANKMNIVKWIKGTHQPIYTPSRNSPSKWDLELCQNNTFWRQTIREMLIKIRGRGWWSCFYYVTGNEVRVYVRRRIRAWWEITLKYFGSPFPLICPLNQGVLQILLVYTNQSSYTTTCIVILNLGFIDTCITNLLCLTLFKWWHLLSDIL